MIVALMNCMPGVGKTTLATHLADDLSADGGGVCLIDADPRADALNWAQRRIKAGYPSRFRTVPPARTQVREDLRDLAQSTTHLVIDMPARVTPFAQLVLMMADLVLVPWSPRFREMASHSPSTRMIVEARRCRHGLRAALVMNRCIEETFLPRSTHVALAGEALPLCSIEVRQRRVFAQSAATGLLVREIAPHGTSAAEILFLSQEVRSFAP